jgi:hypothetical protein
MNSISPQWTRAKSNAWLAFASFLVWPFFSLVYAIANWRTPWAKNIVWLFCGFFGFTFVISNEGIDASRYSSYLLELNKLDLPFLEYLSKINSGELYGRGDYLEPIIRYLVSTFTVDYRILFLVFGLIMGYFLSRNIWTILSLGGDRIKHQAIPYLSMFVILVPFWQINGFRFWTATHIFIFAVIQLYLYRNYKLALWMLALSYLTHLAFIFPISILLIFNLVPKKFWIFFALLFSSLVLVKLELGFFISLIPENMTGPQLEVAKGYLLEEYVTNKAKAVKALNWYARYQSFPVYLFVVFMSILLLIRRKQLLSNEFIRNIFYYGLMLFCVTNMINVIPSTGRFYTLSYMCIFGALFLIAQNVKISRGLQFINYTSAVFIILFILIQIRVGLQFIGPGSIFYNPLFGWALENRFSFVS